MKRYPFWLDDGCNNFWIDSYERLVNVLRAEAISEELAMKAFRDTSMISLDQPIFRFSLEKENRGETLQEWLYGVS